MRVKRSSESVQRHAFWTIAATLAIAGFCSFQCPAADKIAVHVTINNIEPRRDTDGNIIDAHDGCLEFFAGRFFLYGTRYGKTNGFGKTNRYVCYSSPDLMQWTPHGEILPAAPPALYYRPYVKFNQHTKKYVLWYNVDYQYSVADSDTPTGPFIVRSRRVSTKHGDTRGDFGLFIDDDGTGYITYSCCSKNWYRYMNESVEPIHHHQIYVERLTPDYLGTTGQASEVIAGNCEAPSLFKRNGTYYLLFDNTCCFGVDGSGARVYTSSSPIGPYTYRGNINVKSDRAAGAPIVWSNPGSGRADAIIHAQQTHVATVPGKAGPLLIWMGDRWGSRPDGIKGHDFQYWSSPLKFDSDGMIRQLCFEKSWSTDLVLPR